MSEYLLTIYMPTYNRAELAARQVEFLRNECAPYMDKVQIVISNNCSTDDTEERIKKIIEETKIEYYCNEKNIGIRANYYMCKNYVKGEYLWTVSDDDVIKKGAVKHVIDVLEKKDGLNFVMLNYGIKSLNGLWVPWTGKCGYLDNALPELYYGCNGYVIITTTAVIYRYKFFEITMATLPVNDISCYGMHFFTGALAIKAGKTYISKDVWVEANNTSGWYDRMIMSYCGMMKAFVKLDDMGFSEDEIRNLYKGYVMRVLFWEIMSSRELIAQETVRTLIARYPERFMRWAFDYHKHVYSTDVITEKIKRHQYPVYIYCAGFWGREAVEALQNRGIVVEGFFDGAESKWGKQIQVIASYGKHREQEIGSLTCYNFDEFCNNEIQVVIAIQNKKEARKIKKKLIQSNVKCVYLYYGFVL